MGMVGAHVGNDNYYSYSSQPNMILTNYTLEI